MFSVFLFGRGKEACNCFVVVSFGYLQGSAPLHKFHYTERGKVWNNDYKAEVIHFYEKSSDIYVINCKFFKVRYIDTYKKYHVPHMSFIFL